MSHPMDAILGTPKAHRSHLVSTERAHISNRELLEMAAKAYWAGTDVSFWVDESEDGISYIDASNQDYNGQDVTLIWLPHHDDGNCARMEAALGIHVTWHSDGVVCGLRWAGHTELFKDHGGDRNAARRAASLQVAYATGKAMP